MITKAFYEFIILVNLGDCLSDVNKLRQKLSDKYDFQLFDSGELATKWLSKKNSVPIKTEGTHLTKLIIDESKKIIKKYQQDNIKNENFVDSFVWFILTNSKLYRHSKPFRVKSFFNKETGEKEVWIKVNKNTTNTHWENGWEIVEKHLAELQEEYLIEGKKNLQENFEIRLEIYKIYLRAKKYWKGKVAHQEIYKSDEMNILMNKLEGKEKHMSSDGLRKIVYKFKKDYKYLSLVSDSELSIPLTKNGKFSN